METQQKKQNNGFLVLVGLGVLVFIVYWFAIRPANIRSECRTESINNSINYTINGGSSFEHDTAKRTETEEDLASQLYTSCLHEKGLESPFLHIYLAST